MSLSKRSNGESYRSGVVFSCFLKKELSLLVANVKGVYANIVLDSTARRLSSYVFHMVVASYAIYAT